MTICIYTRKNSAVARFEGAWDWNEYDDALRIAAEMAEEMPGRPALVLDCRQTEGLPGEFSVPASTPYPLEGIFRHVIIVGLDAAKLAPLSRLASRVAPQVHHAPSMEAAFRLMEPAA